MPERFTSFEPVCDPDDIVLILGTMPSPASVRQNFYYSHPQNRFWKMLSALLVCPLPQTIEEKRAMLSNNKIALWDVLMACEREGAADASISAEKPNNVAGLLKRCPRITCIALNGAKAHALFKKHIAHSLPEGLTIHKLPSTSPANAACNLQKLCEAWHVILRE